MAVFADLDLRAGSDLKALRGLVENAAHLGYSVVAINHVVEFKEKKQEIEKPISVSELFTTLPIVQGKSKPIKILTRLTIIVSDPSHCNVLRATSSRVRLYDIVAVFPKTEKLFHVACTHLDVDLVCITVTEKLPFYFKRPPINVMMEWREVLREIIFSLPNIEVGCSVNWSGRRVPIDLFTQFPFTREEAGNIRTFGQRSEQKPITQALSSFMKGCYEQPFDELKAIFIKMVLEARALAIDRGVGFELVYSPAIKDSTMRRYTISNALNLMQICKGKNVIISSAAERPLEIRGPYDVANLGLLFGLSESDAKAAVSTNCRAALLHGETRKTAFGIISTVKKPRPSEGNDDSLPASKKAKCED